MSADNVIYVGKGKDSGLWFAWHDFASNDFPYPRGEYAKVHFKSKREAFERAVKILEDIGYVEYGIQLVDEWSKPTDTREAVEEAVRMATYKG